MKLSDYIAIITMSSLFLALAFGTIFFVRTARPRLIQYTIIQGQECLITSHQRCGISALCGNELYMCLTNVKVLEKDAE